MTLCDDDNAFFGRELMPCPFCGSHATMFTMPEGSGIDGSMYVECDEPLCRASSALIYPLKDDVKHILIERWNRRLEPKNEQ